MVMDKQKRKEIIKSLDGLRFTDISDGLDYLGMQDLCLIDPSVEPLWRDMTSFRHRIYGFAFTVRFLPADKVVHGGSYEDYAAEIAAWRKRLWGSGWSRESGEDDIIVAEMPASRDPGVFGSENMQRWVNRGVRGLVTNAGCRDTDEVILQQIPVYSTTRSRGIVPGRVIFEAVNVKVNIADTLVRPGDVIVADGDGVIAMPVEIAEKAIAIARQINDRDRSDRRKNYEAAGMELDFSNIDIK